jgi:hypothetical protein
LPLIMGTDITDAIIVSRRRQIIVLISVLWTCACTQQPAVYGECAPQI